MPHDENLVHLAELDWFKRFDWGRVRPLEYPGLYTAVLCGARTAAAIALSPVGGLLNAPHTDEVSIVLLCGRGTTDALGAHEEVLTTTDPWKYIPVAECGGPYSGPGAVIIEKDPVVNVSVLSTEAVFANARATTRWQDQRFATPEKPFNQRYRDLRTNQILTNVNRHFDLSITFRSWQAGGQPAPDVHFWWVCVAAAAGVSFDA